MTTENGTGIQTRAMTEAQRTEDGAQRQFEQVQGANSVTTGQGTPNPDAQNPAMNPMVDLYKTDDEVLREFVRRNGAIGLDWYVPNLSNT